MLTSISIDKFDYLFVQYKKYLMRLNCLLVFCFSVQHVLANKKSQMLFIYWQTTLVLGMFLFLVPLEKSGMRFAFSRSTSGKCQNNDVLVNF
jgi:hypothetical protein